MTAWAGSTRRSRLPNDWATTRRRILRRDPDCKLNYPGCTGRSTEVDHITAGDNHHDTNLQGACHPCHLAKSAREGVEARQRRPPRTRKTEQHPALKARRDSQTRGG